MRELWQPNPQEQMAAVEVLLASDLPGEARRVVRDLEQRLSAALAIKSNPVRKAA